MKRWTNGLPGATTRLGAMMAHRGLSASQPGCARIPMMVRSKICSTQRPDTLMQLPRSSLLETLSCNARPGHTSWHKRRYSKIALTSPVEAKQTSHGDRRGELTHSGHRLRSAFAYRDFMSGSLGYSPMMFTAFEERETRFAQEFSRRVRAKV